MKKVKEFIKKMGKLFYVVLLILVIFVAYATGFFKGNSRNKNTITQNSSFFTRNSKEIAEGFKKEIEEDGTMKVQKTEFKKGEVHMTVNSTDETFDTIEYILTERGVRIVYTSMIDVSEDQYKQLLVNGNFVLN
jgi:predicted RND superfamily exporter protein